MIFKRNDDGIWQSISDMARLGARIDEEECVSGVERRREFK